MLLPPGSVWWKVSSIGLYGSAGAINASPPEQRTEPHFLRPTTDQKSGWSYLHRGNPRRFSLNIPSKTVRPN